MAVEPDPPFLGCGWFDSSHELRAGLAVVEFEALDAAAVVIEGAAV